MTACRHCGGTGLEPDGAGLFEVEPFAIAHPPLRRSSIEVVAYSDAGSFDDFWRDYPRKQAKATAVKSWNRMTHPQRVSAVDALPSHVAMWDREGRGTRLVPMATTWLNQQRWEDDLSGYVDDSAPRKQMPGRTGIQAALANRRPTTRLEATERREIGDGS